VNQFTLFRFSFSELQKPHRHATRFLKLMDLFVTWVKVRRFLPMFDL